MSEIAPPNVPSDAAVSGTPNVNEVLDDFRRWCAEALAGGGQAPPVAPPAVDLATLLGHFVALRQEINLQTRSVRAQQEQTAEFARSVQQSIDNLARPASVGDESEQVRSLVKSLIDAYDALALAGQQVRKSRDSLQPAFSEMAPPQGEGSATRKAEVKQPFWRRWFSSPTEAPNHADGEQTQQRAEAVRQAAQRVTAALDGLVAGYTMSLERIDRALRQHGLEPVATEGRSFDPELMEALEPVAGTGRPAGEVVEEVRRGYRQGGRVVRCALVRVARD
jgi:molecular chaperone GrpE (heat shock protein)